MRNPLVLVLCAAVIGAILCAGCLNTPESTMKPDVTTTEVRVQYDRPIHANYGTGDCFIREDIAGQQVIHLRSGHCLMHHASFGKLANDTQPGVLRADLVRDGQIIKSYSTETAFVSFEKVDEFLVRSANESGLVQNVPITAKIVTDGEYDGQITDKYGGQYERRSGPVTLTLTQPVLPVEACATNRGDSASATLAVELYQGEKLLKRSGVKDAKGQICVTFP